MESLTDLDNTTSQDLKGILQQSLQALQYLHDEKGMTHDNILPDNIFVQSKVPNLKIKLGDLAPPIQEICSRLQTFYGTPKHDAPERLFGRASPPADIGSLSTVACAAIKCEPVYSVYFDSDEWATKRLDTVQAEVKGPCSPVVPLLKRMLSIKLSQAITSAVSGEVSIGVITTTVHVVRDRQGDI